MYLPWQDFPIPMRQLLRVEDRPAVILIPLPRREFPSLKESRILSSCRPVEVRESMGGREPETRHHPRVVPLRLTLILTEAVERLPVLAVVALLHLLLVLLRGGGRWWPSLW